MTQNKQTRQPVAGIASKILRNPRASKATKAVAASALSQVAPKRKKPK